MLEAGFVAALVAGLAALAAGWSLVPLDVLLFAGIQLVVAGLVFGVPTGLAYHVALGRSLQRAGRLPPRWWLQPTRLHDRIPAQDRARVLAWCYAGAAGFVVTAVGCALGALAAARLVLGAD